MSAKKTFKIVRCFDKELIRWLHDKIFPADVFHDEESIDWIIVTSHGEPVGFCMLSEWDRETAYMARAGVMKSCQGYGLHRRMILVREKFARAQGFTKIMTYTKIHNIQSSVNLQKAKFQLYIPEHEYADDDCLYWMKDLVKRKPL